MRNENDRERNALDYGFSQSCRVTFPYCHPLPSGTSAHVRYCLLYVIYHIKSHLYNFLVKLFGSFEIMCYLCSRLNVEQFKFLEL